MLGQALVAIQVGLVIAALWLGYGMGRTLVQGSDTPDIALPPLENQAREEQTLEAYRVITSRDLFHTAQEPAPVAPPPVKISKSAFAVRLVGTATSPDEIDESLAILESKVSGKKMVVRVGDPLFGATVDSIDRSRVVVMNKGKLEEIVPPENPKAAASKARPKRRSPAVVTAAAMPSLWASASASSLAPRWPPRRGTTAPPSSASATTGGSARLSSSRGARARIRMPAAQRPTMGARVEGVVESLSPCDFCSWRRARATPAAPTTVSVVQVLVSRNPSGRCIS